MLTNFRQLCALCSFGALLIIAGFFLTSLPVFIQILFLLAGLTVCIMTMIGLFRFYKNI
jgi:hypothetical protein